MRDAGTDLIRQRGVTLAEMLVALALATLGMTLGAPAFRDSIATAHQRTAVSELRFSVLQARSEAIRTGSTAAVEPLDPGGDWSLGWRVYLDRDGDARFDASADTLLSSTAAPRGVRQSPATSAKAFRVAPSGFLAAVTNSCVAFVRADGEGAAARAVIVSATGRTRVAAVSAFATSCS